MLFGSTPSGHVTEDDLRTKLRIPEWLCSKCGGVVSLLFSGAGALEEHHLCFTCNFWRDKLTHLIKPATVVAGGVLYSIRGEKASGPRGFGGRKFVIRFHDGREVTTTNLWSAGAVPTAWVSDFPDNAEFK